MSKNEVIAEMAVEGNGRMHVSPIPLQWNKGWKKTSLDKLSSRTKVRK